MIIAESNLDGMNKPINEEEKLSQEEKYKHLKKSIEKKMKPIYNYLFNRNSDEYLNNVVCAGREC